MTFHPRLGCSTISFRHLDLPGALETIAGLGFTEIDLGALPGVCDHVPYILDEPAVAAVAKTVAASGLQVRSVNGDVGDLNWPLSPQARVERTRHLDMLLSLAEQTEAQALVLPCGALDHEPVDALDHDLDLVAAELTAAAVRAAGTGVEIWTESLHFFRLCFNTERAQQLTDRLVGSGVGLVMDFSHIVASGGSPEDFINRFHERIAHVHLRDAVPGDINLSIGNGQADFAGGLKALADKGYTGHFSLELETRDVTNDQRPAAAARAAAAITNLI
ncbi:sugar phosphate isomerase/epimerase family protein [Crystallibacter degradans]|uniref:sugar phosphate isomerase/epimerase family protein n=1 Tax=Crystallibacter degradans TaxID=2726743 RepID=UPI001476361B|nr:sugar phosphate isomerase/epimerase [Arthrobacter sp. SF27]NMR29185.1 sugar phosphate isomerase/epimerase [Arthrobacter sp. SF27]